MYDALIDSAIDSLKLLPFLFISFLFIEILEHKTESKFEKIISKSKKMGPIIGSLLGAVPQCGFSVLATNLYITRIISLGTLISIYLSTSDEMLPVLISEHASFDIVLKLIISKIIIGIIYGFIIDIIYRNKKNEVFDICEEDDCHCEKGILHSTLVHTFKTLFYIFIVTLFLNVLIEYIGTQNISKLFLKDNLFAPLLASLFGLIPNCASSVMLTELYIHGAINFASVIAGCLSAAGVSLLVLFRTNKNIKENLNILFLLYITGALTGFLINVVSLF